MKIRIIPIGLNSLVVVSLLTLSACGGDSKIIKTKDGSTEYKSAVSLPPLKKVLVPKAQTQPAPAPVEYQAEADTAIAAQDIAPSAADSNDYEAPEIVAEVEQEASASIAEAPAASEPVSVQIVEGSDSTARLEISGEYESAWSYISRQLIAAGVTVHNRNYKAGRISIGCGEMETQVEVIKKGGWSIFNRKSVESLEYCALQLVSHKNGTNVRVLNRGAHEVSSEVANRLFNKILAGNSSQPY